MNQNIYILSAVPWLKRVNPLHRGGPSIRLDQSMLDLWRTKRHWDRLCFVHFGILVNIIRPKINVHLFFNSFVLSSIKIHYIRN